MSETIAVALLGFFGTLCGAYFANKKTTALVVYRLEQLEDKVNLHNKVIERTYALEKHSDVVDEQMKTVNKRVGELEKFHLHE